MVNSALWCPGNSWNAGVRLSSLSPARGQIAERNSLSPNKDIVARVWRICSILRKDGVTYQQYVAEITYLLFLKMVTERGQEASLPDKTSWTAISAVESDDRLAFYHAALRRLGDKSAAPIRRIFDGATTLIRDGRTLQRVMERIDEIEWIDAERDSFGDLYEGILEKNAEEAKRGAGQYFTPRALVEAIVELMAPKSGDVVQDPAAGTGGFLVASARYSREKRTNLQLSGMENVPDTHRLLLMNLLLHDIPSDDVLLGDTLSPDHRRLPEPTLILTNPPFGPAGGKADRPDLSVTADSSSFAPPFVEHCIRALAKGGRAAIVVPDSVLYEGGRVKALRRLMLEQCELEVVLKLPSGIFYAQGVKTHVLFLRKGKPTKEVWFYDLRTDMPTFGKNRPFSKRHLNSFIEFFSSRNGRSKRKIVDDPRAFLVSRDVIAARDEDLAISAQSEDDIVDEALIDPEDMIAAAADYVGLALSELRLLAADIEADKLIRKGDQ